MLRNSNPSARSANSHPARSSIASLAATLATFLLLTPAARAEPPSTPGAAADTSSSQGAKSHSQTQEGASHDNPPSYSVVKWDEDYSYLRDPAKRTDLWDPIKYIPLNDAGDYYLSFGGQLRDRYEFFNHFTFGSGAQDRNGYNLFRFIGNVDAHFGPNLRVFAQFRSADLADRDGGPRGRDTDSADLQQGFVELDFPLSDETSLTLRAGRQQMVLGRERLIGISDFSNATRNYDAIRATLKSHDNVLDVFAFKPVNVDRYTFDQNDARTSLIGVYDTITLGGPLAKDKAKLSLYAFDLQVNGTSTYPTVTGSGNEQRYTLGTEFVIKPGQWDFDVEADWQFGRFRTQSIDAYSVATELGYTFAHAPLTPHTFLGFDLATGDTNPRDGHLGTFNQLFPSGHTYFGYIDVIGRQNVIDLHPGVELSLLKGKSFAERVTCKAEYHQFWRESTRDAVYSSSASITRAPGDTSARPIGSEIDLLLNWQVDRHLSSYLGYSHFFPQSFIQQTGSSHPIDFVYLAVTYNF